MNGEGIDYGLESGMLAADLFLADPSTAPAEYDRLIGERFDGFLRTGRRFAFLIGHPRLMRTGLRVAVGTERIAQITLQVMGNLVDSSTPGAAGLTMRVADRSLGPRRPPPPQDASPRLMPRSGSARTRRGDRRARRGSGRRGPS